MFIYRIRTVGLLAALLAAVAGCGGDRGLAGNPGADGAQGPQGATGPKGEPGVASGVIQGTLTYSLDGTTELEATGVTVSLLPDVGVTAVSDAQGSFSLTAPLGVYSVQFSGGGFAAAKVDGVAVSGGRVTPVTKRLTVTTRFVVVPASPPVPAGFGKTVQLDVGATAALTDGITRPLDVTVPGWSFAWELVSGPTAVTLSDPAAKAPTFTTGTLAAIAASPKLVGFSVPSRAQLVGVSYQQMLDMSYQFRCTLTDPQGFKASALVAVKPAVWTAGGSNMAALGVPLIAASKPGDTGAWTLSRPAGSAAALADAASANPTFTPDVVGTYVLTRGTGTTITVNAGKFYGSSQACGECHIPTVRAKVDAKWAAYASSKHGTVDVTSAGLDGAEGPYFSSECLTCHTTGYNPYAANGGFDDVAALDGWKFPAKLQPGNAAAMPADLARMNKVQCESCHGPMGAHENLVTLSDVKPKAEYRAATCAACHDELPYADRYRLWSGSPHARTELTAEATVEAMGTFAAHCGRCHAAQGFVQYVKQQQGQLADPNNAGKFLPPNAGSITKLDGTAADASFLAALGLDADHVEPQSCQTCHDPHTTGVRVPSDTGVLASGFAVYGAGSGAVCMACHNTRNGARGDGLALPAGTTSIGAGHAPSQTDVFAGKNAYFVGSDIRISKHAAVADTCAGCHVKLVPAGVAAMGTNHTFRADGTICKSCHSPEISLEQLETRFLAARSEALAAMATALGNVIGAQPWTLIGQQVNAAGNAVAATAPTSPGALPSTVSISVVHGTPYLVLGFATLVPDPFGASGATTDTLMTKASDIKINGVAVAQMGVLNKAVWNVMLVSSQAVDEQGTPELAANVVHNPTFVFDVLSATKAALLSATASGGANPL